MNSENKQNPTIDDYIKPFPESTKTILNKIHSIIKDILPKDAIETISYGIPTFKLNGKFVIYFAGYAKHISLYPIPHGDEDFRQEIAPFIKGKGTLQFPLDKPIPYDLIKKVAKQSLIANLERTQK